MRNKMGQPNAAMGYPVIAISGIVLILAICFSHDLGQKCRGMSVGLLGLSWGLKQVAAVRKWKQEPEETPAELIRETAQEEKRKSKLIGRYKPSLTNVVIFCVFTIPMILLFISLEIPRATAGNIRTFDFVLLAALLIYCAISSEVNLRCVTVDEASMSSHGPLRIYRQNVKLSEVVEIRQTKMNDRDSAGRAAIEVQFRGRWIVFVCNRRFKERVEEVFHAEDVERRMCSEET